MTYVTMRGSVFRARTSFASAPSSTSGASVRRWTPSSVLRRSPRSTFSSMRFHTGGGSWTGRTSWSGAAGHDTPRRTRPTIRTPVPRVRDGRRRSALRERLLLAPGERHELAAVLGQLLLDRVRGVEHGHAAVELDVRRAPADDAAQDPGVTVHVDVALDVDEALVREVRV